MDSVFEDYKRRVRQWLIHVNPYTGVAIKDEPALISFSYLNEANPNSFWSATPFSKSLYEKAFQGYCRQHGLSSKPGVRRDMRVILMNFSLRFT